LEDINLIDYKEFDTFKNFLRKYDYEILLLSKNGQPISFIALKYMQYTIDDLVLICGSSPFYADCIFWKKVGTLLWNITYDKKTFYNIDLSKGELIENLENIFPKIG
jgi:hypothetical protein